jgi:hypothetical protein
MDKPYVIENKANGHLVSIHNKGGASPFRFVSEYQAVRWLETQRFTVNNYIIRIAEPHE